MDATFFDRYRDAWNSHDVDQILEFFTDDGIYEDVALGRLNRGKDAIRAFIAETFAAFPDFRLADEGEILISPDGRFAIEWTMSGTHEGDTPALPATHKSFAVRGASAGEVQGDLIKRNSDYWSLAEFLVQVGILPPMPTG